MGLTKEGWLILLLEKGVAEFNKYRARNSGLPDLRGADLCEKDLWGVCFERVTLREADLQGVNLQWADLRNADLQGANLERADLRWANLQGASLQGATLKGARLENAILTREVPQEGL